MIGYWLLKCLRLFLLLSDRKMKMLVPFGILLHISQHALAGVVEVYKGAESVLLPCHYSGIVPDEDLSMLWTLNDPRSIVHLRREQGDDYENQDRHYRGRTSMRPDAPATRDFSLTLRQPHLSDSRNYTCSITNGKEELKLTQVQLKVKDNQIEVKVNENAESVVLPCETSADLKEDTVVEWTRSEPYFSLVHVFPNTSKLHTKQDNLYCSRTEMNVDLLRTGDLSLTLKFPTDRDSGSYICTVYRDENILRQKVVLHHVREGPFQTWATVLLICVVLLVVVVVGVVFLFQYYLRTDYYVKVESGEHSVLLPSWYLSHRLKNVEVKWTDSQKKVVYVHKNGRDGSEEQGKAYEGRTEMHEGRMKLGDLSLTLRYPSARDTQTYTCTIRRNGKDLMKKRVTLDVQVLQIDVESAQQFVEFPFKISEDFPKDVKVEWRDQNKWTVHVFQDGSDQPNLQHWYYKERTEMNANPLEEKDLSLTVIYVSESGTLTCTVYNKEGKILRRKEIVLNVKVPEVVVEPGAKFVQLPFKTTEMLTCEDIEVEWMNSKDRRVHRFHHGLDHRDDQFCSYRYRTELNKDQIKTGDFSLTLKYPTDWDSDVYSCKVYTKEGTILTKKRVELNVRDCRVEMQEGLIQLPFKTTPDFLKDSRVQWSHVEPKYRKIHVANSQNRSDQPEEPEEYRNRTKMNENWLETGDLTLTIKDPTDDDLGKYKCVIFGKDNQIMQEKTVQVETKVEPEEPESTPLISNSPVG